MLKVICSFKNYKLHGPRKTKIRDQNITSQFHCSSLIWMFHSRKITNRNQLHEQGLFITQPAFTCSKLTIETLEQRCEICSKLTIKTPNIFNFEHISHLCSSVSIVSFEHVIAGWEGQRYLS